MTKITSQTVLDRESLRIARSAVRRRDRKAFAAQYALNRFCGNSPNLSVYWSLLDLGYRQAADMVGRLYY